MNQREMEEKKLVLASKPLRLGIVLTNLCNLRCIMCHEDRYRGTDTLPKSSLKKINEVLPYIELINWQGGEIFCVGYMKEIFREFLNYPYIQHNITTNGLLIDKDWAEILINLKVSLSFSIDSVTKDTYEYIRRGAKFERLIENINLLNDMEQNYQRSIHKTIIVVVMESNYRQLHLFIDFAKKYGFKELWFYPVIPKPEYEKSIFIDMNSEVKQELRRRMKIIKQLGSAFDLDIQCRLPGIEIDSEIISPKAVPSNENRHLFCIFPWKTMWIDATRKGRITPGCPCTEEIGNIYTDSLLEVWNGSKMQEYRRRIANNDLSLCNNECLSELVVKKRLTQDY